LDELGSVRGIEPAIANVKCQKVPQPTGLNQELLAAAQVKSPDTLPLRKTHAATRKTVGQLIYICISICDSMLNYHLKMEYPLQAIFQKFTA